MVLIVGKPSYGRTAEKQYIDLFFEAGGKRFCMPAELNEKVYDAVKNRRLGWDGTRSRMSSHFIPGVAVKIYSVVDGKTSVEVRKDDLVRSLSRTECLAALLVVVIEK